MIGIDIVEISRIRTLIGDDAFIRKIFTENEIAYCCATKSAMVKAQRFAARFAAKEAIFKAVESLTSIPWNEIEIRNEASGKPIVQFYGQTKKLIEQEKLKLEISLSHSRHYAVAAAVIT